MNPEKRNGKTEKDGKNKEQLHRRMTEGAVFPLLLRLSLPNTAGLLVIALYTLADSYFVSHIGTDAGAAVGAAFPIHVLTQAVGYTLGLGAGSLLSRALGKKDVEAAEGFARTALLFALLAGGIITAAGLGSIDGLLRFLGAYGEAFPLAKAYTVPLLWAAVPMCVTFVSSQLLRAEGRVLYAMTGLLAGSLCNVVLDPLLITRAELGIAGASTATLISQSIAAAVLLSAYATGRSELRLFRKSGKRRRAGGGIGKIFVTGLPSLFRQGLSGIATVITTRTALAWGNEAVTAMSVVSRVFLLVFSLCLGIGQGMMPIVGYNQGAGDEERVKKAYKTAVKLSTGVMAAISVPMIVWAPQIMSFFQRDEAVVRIGTEALRAQSAVMAVQGVVTCTILCLQARGKNTEGTVLAAARQGLFFLPMIFLLPERMGIRGLEIAQPAADLATAVFAIPFARKSGKEKMKK